MKARIRNDTFLSSSEATVCGGILARIGPDCYENVCDESGVELAVMRGRPMNGWVRVNVEKLRTRKQLERWLAYCLTYTDQIPPKK